MSKAIAETIALTAPVHMVTVLEDRAQVTRKGRLRLTAGRHVLRVERVTPLVVDRTLRARCAHCSDATAGVRVVDLRIERESTVAATRPALQQELKDKLQDLRDRRETELQQLTLAEGEGDALSTARAHLLQAACRQAGRGVDHRDSWAAGLSRIAGELERNSDERRRLAAAAEDLEDQIRRLSERLLLALQPTVCHLGTLFATIECDTEGEHEISWEYLVPCAVWRPSHQAELSRSTLRWTLFGTVWQHTGEPWDGVTLRLSTERPALGADLPLLDEDLLHLRPRTDREKDVVEVAAHEEAIEVVSPGLEPYQVSGAVPGVDDGGEARVFELAQPVSIPSDGRAHLVALGSFETATEVDLICLAEAAPTVVLRSQQQNASSWPLLAGPVRLVRNGGFSGRCQTDFVAPGERFALGWGSLDDLQVVRRTGDHAEGTTLTRRTRRTAWTEVFLSNTGEEARRVTVVERIPVSEVEEVKVTVEDKGSTSGWRGDKHGHLRLTVDLAAAAQTEVRLRYTVDAHRKVVWR